MADPLHRVEELQKELEKLIAEKKGQRETYRKFIGMPLIFVGGIIFILVVFGALSCNDHQYLASSRDEAFKAQRSIYHSVPAASPSSPEPKSADKGMLWSRPAEAAESSPVAERMLVYTAELILKVDKIADEAVEIKKIVEAAKGYISSTAIEGEENSSSVQMVLRIPTERYSETMEKLSALGKLIRRQESISDVTTEFIDNQARLSNQKKQEAAVVELLKRNGKLSDILEIEKELARIRGEIESLEGRQRYLQNQAAYSTVTVTVQEKEPLPLTPEWSLRNTFANAKISFIALGRTLITAAIYLGVFLPYVLGLYVGWRMIGWWIGRRKKAHL